MRGKRVAVGLSGGLDSVVLLHAMHGLAPQLGYKLSAIHVNHGLSPNAGDWQKFCSVFCLELGIPFKAIKVDVKKKKHGLEAAAREARRAAFASVRADAIALAHHLDDQAETVLFNLLRGTGLEGASGMPATGRLGKKLLLRPLLGMPRSAIRAYARRASPRLDRGRIECRRVADAQFHPPARRAAAGGEIPALAREPCARGAPLRRRGTGCAAPAARLPEGQGPARARAKPSSWRC